MGYAHVRLQTDAAGYNVTYANLLLYRPENRDQSPLWNIYLAFLTVTYVTALWWKMINTLITAVWWKIAFSLVLHLTFKRSEIL
jgi:hypothetical protein